MIEGSDLLQDLNQILGAKLTGSTAGLDETGQSHVLHDSSVSRCRHSYPVAYPVAYPGLSWFVPG
jgi:hypothetical protein